MRDDGTGFEMVMAEIFRPNMEGIETIRTLRRNHSGIPIIAMSGDTGMRTQDYLYAAGTFGTTVVLTTFENRVLLAAIEKALA